MLSPAAQARAQALNAKLEGEARAAVDTVERHILRKIARESHACALKCYDKAGTGGPGEALEACVHQCQAPHQQSNAYVQSVRRMGKSWRAPCDVPSRCCCFFNGIPSVSPVQFGCLTGTLVLLLLPLPGDGSVPEPAESGHGGMSGQGPRFDATRVRERRQEDGQSGGSANRVRGQDGRRIHPAAATPEGPHPGELEEVVTTAAFASDQCNEVPACACSVAARQQSTVIAS